MIGNRMRYRSKLLAVLGVLVLTTANAPGAEPGAADVVVYGGTPGGIVAAVAATRNGATALLVEPTRHVGGLSTSGINTAESEHMLKWTFGGIALEFYRRLGKHYGTGHADFFFESSAAERVYLDMLREAKVDVRYGAAVERVEKDGAKITRVVLTDGSALSAKVFVDASYEGDLMARAGVSYAIGRESREAFGEEAAGVRFDKTPRAARTVDGAGRLLPGVSARKADLVEGAAHRGVMNYNFRLTFAKDPKWRLPIPEPANYDPAQWESLRGWVRATTAAGKKLVLTDFLDFYARRSGKYEVNNKQAAIVSLGDFGAQFDYPDADYATRAKIVEAHRQYTLGLLHFLATDPAVPPNVRDEMKAWGLHKGEFADNGNWPYQLYVREARRMRGAYVMTQKDVQQDRRKDDAIGISSHFIDSHHVQRVAVSDDAFVNEGRIWRPGCAYQIPYRAITPKAEQAENLLVPVAASYTHVAFCTLRLESVWMIAGHAAGAAAAMAARDGGAVQRVDVPALQKALRAQGQVVDFVPGEKEKWDGPVSPPAF
jgi:hypothetical protein